MCQPFALIVVEYAAAPPASKQQSTMGKRTSPNDLAELDDLNDLSRIVKDKRQHKRANEKKERRNRHYVKLLIKQQAL